MGDQLLVGSAKFRSRRNLPVGACFSKGPNSTHSADPRCEREGRLRGKKTQLLR